MIVSDIHAQEDNEGAWLLAIEGTREMYTDALVLAGSGPGSWIGTAYGDRVVKTGLVMPAELPFGETKLFDAMIFLPSPATISIVDMDGELVQLFADFEPDDSTDTLAGRLSPLDDPAPDPVPGIGGELISIWDRNVGIERIGPAGERRHFWVLPGAAPPGFDHFASPGWPAVRSTERPSLWAGRRVAVYRIVRDPDTGAWPSWQDQLDGGSLLWFGTVADRADWDQVSDGRYSGRGIKIPVLGPASWIERSIGLSRPSQWYPITAGISLSGDAARVAAWIEPVEFEPLGDGINYAITKYDAHTLTWGSIAGLSTPTEIWSRIRDIAYTAAYGTNNGVVLAANNSQWTGPTASLGPWGNGDPLRRIRISPNGNTVEIKCEPEPSKLGFRLGLAMHATAAQAAGWDVMQPPWVIRSQIVPEGVIAVGGSNWGEPVGGDVLPPLFVVGRFSTRDELADPPTPSWQWANNGAWRSYQAPYPEGTVTLDHEGGTLVGLGFDLVRAEGQHGNPYTFGADIDGAPVDACGWWLFRGKRLLAADFLAGKIEPSDYVGVAFCEWVANPTRDAVETNGDGVATIRIVRWEDPRRYGLPYDRPSEPWVGVAGGIEATPISVLGAQAIGGQGWRHRAIVTTLLSSGTSEWDETGGVVTITPGDNQPPGFPPLEIAGDIEAADLGVGVPWQFVDWQSIYACAAGLVGGVGGALNRVLYPLVGSEKSSVLLREMMMGAGWAWSLKPGDNGVPAFGAFDPLKPIDPAEVVATIRRSDIAEPSIAIGQPQWRATVELRRDGPYDRFLLRVGGSPLGGDGVLERVLESLDGGRRARSGRTTFEVRDRGLRDPAPWVGTPAQPQFDWGELARLRFAGGFGPHLARQRRVWHAVLSGRLAGRLGLGSAVHVIDPTAETTDGTRGVNHRGRVVELSIVTGARGRTSVRVAVELEREPVDAVHVWGPWAYSGRGGWDAGTSTLTVAADVAGVGSGWDDALSFERPSWTAYAAGPLLVTIYQSETGSSWDPALTCTAEVASVAAQAIELASVVGLLLRDTIKLVVAQPLDDQTAEWAQELLTPITDAAGKYNLTDKGYKLS